MGIFSKKQQTDKTQVVLPSGKDVTIEGDLDAQAEFAVIMETLLKQLQETKCECSHEWLSGMVCYQIYHTEPKRFQLLCVECGSWIDVEHATWQRYVAKEMHLQNLEEAQAEREATRMHELMEPIYILGGMRNEY